MEQKEQSDYEFGPFVLDTAQHLLLRDQQPVPLTPKTYDTLLVLVENSGRMLSKNELMQAIWPESFVEESNLTVQISAIRKVLGEQRYIVTIPSRGYRFGIEVKKRRRTSAEDGPQERDSSSHVSQIADSSRGDWETSGSLALHAVRRPQSEPVRPRRTMVWVVTASFALATILLVAMLRPPMGTPHVLNYIKITNSGRVDTISDILTDGTRVYFAAHPAGSTTQHLYQASVDGKETAEIPLPFEGFFLCGISPDHSELLIATAPEAPVEHPLWVVSVLGGSPRRVGSITAVDADWTPDGQGIIYSSGPDVYLAKSDGSNLRRLFTAPGFASGFRWSPSGRTLRFTVMDRKTSLDSLWEASSDGSNLHPLLPHWKTPLAEAGWGQWTADGKYYVFGSIRDGKYDVWAIREKRDLLRKYSREPMELSAGPTQLTRPILSPDGRHLFVISAETRGDLLRFDAKSSEFSPLLVGLSAHRLSFTGDGQWVAYTTYPDNELWRSKADGSDKFRLSFSPIRADLPRWSPDGKQIVFMAGEGAKPGDIYVIPRDGGEPKRLLPEGMNGADPDWSPDGMSIVFGPQPTFPQVPPAAGGTAAPAGSIRVVDLNTRKISELPDSAGLYRPRWSTGGNYIAALSVDTHRLKLFDLAARKWTLLATGKTLHNPLWSRDGKAIYFQDLGGPDQPIYRVNVTGQKVERIAGSEMIRRTDIIYSAFTGLTPEDSPIVLTIQTINDIYGLELSLP